MSRKGLAIDPVFCKRCDPYDIEWSKRTVEMKEGDKVVFKQDGVEVPKFWSNNAATILATKYFRGNMGTPNREYSAKQIFNRVVDELVKFAISKKIMDKTSGRIYGNEMKWLLVNQRYSFNSPVYFNVGADKEPQGSACFILFIQDDLQSISRAQQEMIVIFSNGSGAGYNLSSLREAGALLSKGGFASGPNSFLLGYNSWGGIIRSGGVQRRAAMLARLDDWHPDIMDFINLKSKEEKKARALVKKGFTVEEAYATVACQNVNLTAGVSDALMRAALDDRDWTLKAVVGGKHVKVVKAAEVLDAIATNAHFCGDPGVQFDDTINRWNPLSKIGKILSSNPCSEFLGLPNSACNLASINLAAFYDREGGFKEEEFEAAVRLSVISQDILVEMCGYPTEEITKNSRAYRPLGLGFSNLGGLFLKMGIPYDSDLARAWASSITARMTAKAFITSSELARMQGTFTGFEENKRGMLAILKQHKTKFAGVMEQSGTLLPGLDKVEDLWEQAYADAAKYGVRNSAVTLVPPAGTISYLMDCTTQGIEPMLFLMGKKALVGGGELVFLNPVVENTLQYLGYSPQERAILAEYIKENGKLDGSPIRPQHLAIFDPVYPASVGDRHISIQGQMLMMAAVQPFISGAISKTFGLPRNASVQEVKDIIIQSWKLGLKAVTMYRDGSKINQLMTSAVAGKIILDDDEVRRDRLPDDTNAKKHRVVIRDLTGETKMYILPSFYSDGRLGEAFISGLGKEGSSLKGLVEALMTAVSIALQYGVPLEVFAEKFIGTIFSPRGLTSNPKIPICTSLIDYIFRYLMNEFGNEDSPEASLTPSEKAKTALIEHRIGKAADHSGEILTGEMCKCGSLMVRNGAGCKSCLNPSCSNFASSSCGG